MRLRVAVGAGVLAAGLLGGPAWAQQFDSREGIMLQNEILELRQQIQQLGQQRGGGQPVYRAPPQGGGGDQGGLVATLLDRVSTLEDQVRALRGQVEALTNQQQRQQQDFAKQLGDMQFALQNSSSANAALAPQPTQRPQQVSPPPSSLGVIPDNSGLPATPPPRTPELAMQDASAALARRDYAAAAAAAREVIAKRGPSAANAQFLLAMAEMGQRNYQQAAPDFYDAYNRNRTGPRAQESLLGVADALVALGDKQSACDALSKLRTEFPAMRPEVRDAANTTRAHAGCR